MIPAQDRSPSELALLTELRLAFGPGTRLWASRSIEDLCYEWLRFKAMRGNADFREFVRSLYRDEFASGVCYVGSWMILKRVASILRAYRIRRQVRPPTPLARSRTPDDRARPRPMAPVAAVNGTTRLVAPRLFEEPRAYPLQTDKRLR